MLKKINKLVLIIIGIGIFGACQKEPQKNFRFSGSIRKYDSMGQSNTFYHSPVASCKVYLHRFDSYNIKTDSAISDQDGRFYFENSEEYERYFWDTSPWVLNESNLSARSILYPYINPFTIFLGTNCYLRIHFEDTSLSINTVSLEIDGQKRMDFKNGDSKDTLISLYYEFYHNSFISYSLETFIYSSDTNLNYSQMVQSEPVPINLVPHDTVDFEILY